MSVLRARIARCSDHGLHGDRDTCFVCGYSVTQEPMREDRVTNDDVEAVMRVFAKYTGKRGNLAAAHEICEAVLADKADSETGHPVGREASPKPENPS